MDIGTLIAIVVFGLVAGAIGRAIVPNDAFQQMSGPKSWALSTILGVIGAVVGYWIFRAIGIGDDDKFDWGGIIGAVIGAVIVVAIASALFRRMGRRAHV
jgi:uncharacterized membrane protein YeaQ/YmgE (transglycosylase-associated protein family)